MALLNQNNFYVLNKSSFHSCFVCTLRNGAYIII